MLEFFSSDEEATARLAAQIASRAQSGDVFALYGTWEWENQFLPGLLFRL